MNDEDRRILLKRRALFVSAALAASACGASGPATANATPPVEVAPVGSTATPETSKPPKREVDASAPPDIVVPAGASDTARNMYTHLKKSVTRVQIEVAALARSMLTCTTDSCQSDAAVEELARAFASTQFLVGELTPHCPGSSEQGRKYQEAVEEQQKFFKAKLERYRTGLLKRMARVDDFSDRFRAATLRADAAQPRVCLDCGDW